MGARLPEATVRYVERLLRNGTSPTEAARAARISYTTVKRIAQGTWWIKPGKLQRCLRCRRMVRLPCIACTTRAANVPRIYAGVPEGPISIGLRGEEARRYRRLRKQRMQQRQARETASEQADGTEAWFLSDPEEEKDETASTRTLSSV